MVSTYSFMTLLAVLLLSATSSIQNGSKIEWEQIGPVLNEPKQLIMVDMYTEWCGWCKRMDATTFKDSAVVEYLNEHFHTVKFDAEQKEEIVFKGHVYKYVNEGRRGYHELAAALLNGKMSYPTTVFLDEELGVVTRVPGYKSARDFETIAHFVGERAYQSMTFETFKAKFEAKNE